MGADTAKDIAAFDLTPVLNTPEDIAAWADHGRATGGAAAILSLADFERWARACRRRKQARSPARRMRSTVSRSPIS